jgi:hypothetical protein
LKLGDVAAGDANAKIEECMAKIEKLNEENKGLTNQLVTTADDN